MFSTVRDWLEPNYQEGKKMNPEYIAQELYQESLRSMDYNDWVHAMEQTMPKDEDAEDFQDWIAAMEQSA